MDEKIKDLEEGAYLCILNNENEICAASIAYIENGIAQGTAMAIEEKYKMNGFAPVLTYNRCKVLYEKGVKYLQGWVLMDNYASLKYHKGIGYQFINKYADEWILE